MAKVMQVGGTGMILHGRLTGFKGRVVAYDSEENEVWVEIDDDTCIVTTAENVDQEGFDGK